MLELDARLVEEAMAGGELRSSVAQREGELSPAALSHVKTNGELQRVYSLEKSTDVIFNGGPCGKRRVGAANSVGLKVRHSNA